MEKAAEVEVAAAAATAEAAAAAAAKAEAAKVEGGSSGCESQLHRAGGKKVVLCIN